MTLLLTKVFSRRLKVISRWRVLPTSITARTSLHCFFLGGLWCVLKHLQLAYQWFQSFLLLRVDSLLTIQRFPSGEIILKPCNFTFEETLMRLQNARSLDKPRSFIRASWRRFAVNVLVQGSHLAYSASFLLGMSLVSHWGPTWCFLLNML